jgi:hypothetical protein
MRLVFERGDERRPKGHALLYFRDPDGAVLATYVIVPPVNMDLSKYIPPMFAGQGLAAGVFQAPQVIPLPPVPEKVGGVGELEVLAQQRDDDLVSAGDAPASQLETLMTVMAEAAQLYLHLYEDHARDFPAAPAPAEPEKIDAPSAEELTLALMPEREKLSELVKMTGTLRYAQDGHDDPLAKETLERMRLLTKHLPTKYWPDRMMEEASRPQTDPRLLELYVERCYKLLEEDYPAVAQLDERIKAASGR